MLASPASDLSSPASERVAVVIPALNEAEFIGAVIAALPRHQRVARSRGFLTRACIRWPRSASSLGQRRSLSARPAMV